MSSLKAQFTAFLKILFVVLSVALFILLIHQIVSFQALTYEQKEASDFRTEVLNTLQKLVMSESCLAYSENLSAVNQL